LDIDQEKKYEDTLREVEKKLREKKDIKINQNLKEKKFSIYQPNIRSNIIGIIFLIAGLILIFNPVSKIFTNPDALNIKIGVGLILIGLFLIVLIYEKTLKNLQSDKIQETKKIKLLISEKITLALSVWVIILLFITIKASIEIFFILIFIGTLVIKELTEEYTSKNLKNRINIFIFVFLIIFIIIISQKIINTF